MEKNLVDLINKIQSKRGEDAFEISNNPISQALNLDEDLKVVYDEGDLEECTEDSVGERSFEEVEDHFQRIESRECGIRAGFDVTVKPDLAPKNNLIGPWEV